MMRASISKRGGSVSFLGRRCPRIVSSCCFPLNEGAVPTRSNDRGIHFMPLLSNLVFVQVRGGGTLRHVLSRGNCFQCRNCSFSVGAERAMRHAFFTGTQLLYTSERGCSLSRVVSLTHVPGTSVRHFVCCGRRVTRGVRKLYVMSGQCSSLVLRGSAVHVLGKPLGN